MCRRAKKRKSNHFRATLFNTSCWCWCWCVARDFLSSIYFLLKTRNSNIHETLFTLSLVVVELSRDKKKNITRRRIRKPGDTFNERNDDDGKKGRKTIGTAKLLHPPNDTRVRVFPKLLFKRRNPFFVFFFDKREQRREQILFRL